MGEIEEEIAGRVSSSRDSSRDNTPRDSASSDVHLSSSGHSTPLASPSSRRRIKRKDSGLDVNATSPGSRRRGGMPRASSAKSPARLSHDTSPRGVDLKRQMSQREMVSEVSCFFKKKKKKHKPKNNSFYLKFLWIYSLFKIDFVFVQ